LERNTLVVLVGDHGEGLMQHGYLLHGPNIYEEAVRVPLMVRWPDQIPAGGVLSAPVEMVDLSPTILDLLGVEPPPVPIQGRSLAAALRGDEELDPEWPVYLHRQPYKERRLKTLPKYNPQSADSILVKGQKYAIRVGRWKYIEGVEEGTKELFDLDADPGEESNLYSKLPEKAAALASQLESWRQSRTSDGLVQVLVSDEDEQRLHALGYVD
ncbi:MAG: sulfatase-like hydrolase/transferase, partial [Deltaproteobacteria bacterium]|nr:sulfatase-like hydrolase/transferase [Deltaproteobacteria bacterium]